MNKDTLRQIPHLVKELFSGMSDDYLADVLRPWDCYSQQWADDHMHLFRFESDDMLIWLSDGVLQAERGAVDTSVFEPTNRIATKKDPAEDMCLCWVKDGSFKGIIGTRPMLDDLIAGLV